MCVCRRWGGRPHEALLRQGLLSELGHRPTMDVYGNDLVQRGQAGQPVVLSLSLSLREFQWPL